MFFFNLWELTSAFVVLMADNTMACMPFTTLVAADRAVTHLIVSRLFATFQDISFDFWFT